MSRATHRLFASLCTTILAALPACSSATTTPVTADASNAGPDDAGAIPDAPTTSADAANPGTDGASSAGQDASTPAEDAAPAADSGAPATDDASGGACVLAPAWATVASEGCAACQTANCCEQVRTCAADTACTAIFACQQQCFAYLWPDGAPIPHGGGVDDVCANDCITAGSPAAQALFIPQDTCVNTVSCAKACSGG